MLFKILSFKLSDKEKIKDFDMDIEISYNHEDEIDYCKLDWDVIKDVLRICEG
jgi:hypothetical protein